MKVLDYGCGSGGFEEIDYKTGKLRSWLLDNSGPDTHGIDINPLRIEAARNRINNGTKFHVMDGRNLNFPDNYFDIVHEFGVFHHMPDYQAGIAEIHRVLKPGGTIILTESVDNDIAFRCCRRVFNKWHEDEVANLFTSDTLNSSLIKYFEIETQSYHWRFIPSDFLRQYNIEPRISLVFNEGLSRLFNKLGIGKNMCCHYTVKAVKKEMIN